MICFHNKIYKPRISTSCSYEDSEKDVLFDNKEWQEKEFRGLVLCFEKALGTMWRWKVDKWEEKSKISVRNGTESRNLFRESTCIYIMEGNDDAKLKFQRVK